MKLFPLVNNRNCNISRRFTDVKKEFLQLNQFSSDFPFSYCYQNTVYLSFGIFLSCRDVFFQWESIGF